jgi:hypothetical protein
VIKQRIARPNEGASGGYRSVILFRRGDKAFFVYGFAKSNRQNIEENELKEFKRLAKITLAFSGERLANLVAAAVYIELKCHD